MNNNFTCGIGQSVLMRKVIYSERRRRIHAFFKNLYKKSMIYQWLKKGQMVDSASIDPLTGLYNQFGINTFLKALHPQANQNYAIILLNIDNYEKIQHNFGIKAAERALIKTSRILSNNVRDTDLIGKYGTHEFILILGKINLDQANEVAQRCLNLIQNNPIQFNALTITLQASCGVSASKQDVLSDKVLQYADRALFLAKTSGFNQLRDERAIFS